MVVWVAYEWLVAIWWIHDMSSYGSTNSYPKQPTTSMSGTSSNSVTVWCLCITITRPNHLCLAVSRLWSLLDYIDQIQDYQLLTNTIQYGLRSRSIRFDQILKNEILFDYMLITNSLSLRHQFPFCKELWLRYNRTEARSIALYSSASNIEYSAKQ
jgi:hypothetical protein